MANEKTLNRLANYQMVSDLLGTYLDYHQKEREMMMKYGESGDDTERRIIKEGGVNYYADTGDSVLGLDVPTDAEGKRELYQWEDPTSGKVKTGTYVEAEAAEALGASYFKMGTFSQSGSGTDGGDPDLYQWKKADGTFGQGTYKEAKDSGFSYVKMPTGFAQDNNAAGEQIYSWYDTSVPGVKEYKTGTYDEAKASGFHFGKLSTTPQPKDRKIFHQGGIAYYEDTKKPVLDNVTNLGAKGDNKGVNFDLKNGKMMYYSKDDPTTLKVMDIPGWSQSANKANTQVVKDGPNYRIINKDTGDVIHEGAFPGTAGTTHADRKQQTKDSISDFATMYNMKDDPGVAELYKIVDADEDITEKDEERFGKIMDDMVTKKSTQIKETRKNTQSNYGKFINQGLMDKFGPGQGGTVQSFSIPGADVDFTMSTKRGAEWDPTRAAGVLARIKGFQKIAGTNLGQITQEEGGALIADVFVAKHTDYGSVKGGYKLKGNTMTTGVGKDKRETQVTPIDDAFGNKYAYGPNKELFYYDEDNGGVYRKVKGKHAQYTIENGNIVTGNLSKWYMGEVEKYKFID